VEYASSVHQQSNFSQPDSGLIVPGFQKGDDLIDAINHMMSFLTAVVTYRVTIQPIQGGQNSLAASTLRPYTSGPSGNNLRKHRTVVCYNCKGEGHKSKQCTKPKRKKDEAWFKDKIVLMANLSHYGSDNLAEVHNPDKVINQAVQAMLISEQSNIMNQSETKITSDSNIIPYSQYSMKIDNLKQTLSEHLKEKESLNQIVTLLKNDFQKEESRNIDRELDIEKHVNELNNIVFKRNQSAQTVHMLTMLTKPQFFYDHTTRQALGFQNPFYLKKAQQFEPKLYDGSVIQKTNAIMIRDSEETLMLVEESLKERTTATAITEGTWGFEYVKACFKDEIIPFVKTLKDLFNSFDQFLIDELSEVQNVFNQIEQAVEQHRVESNRFQDKIKEVLNENERLLEQAISKDIVNIVVTANVNNAYEHANECERCELEEIETINIELDHRVTKLVTENKKLKQTYKQLHDSIKSSRIQSTKQCDDLIKQVKIKSAENSDLNASLKEKVLVMTTLKDTLRKLKGKGVVDEAVTLHPIDPELLKINVAPLAPKLLNNRTVHYDYLKHTQEETVTLREIVKNERLLNPLNTSLDYACEMASEAKRYLDKLSGGSGEMFPGEAVK
nr:hypothetical protein [Tanacetum cinerariifolium]